MDKDRGISYVGIESRFFALSASSRRDSLRRKSSDFFFCEIDLNFQLVVLVSQY